MKLSVAGKPVVVYLSPKAHFYNVRTGSDLPLLLAECTQGVADRLRRELRISDLVPTPAAS